MIRLRRTISNEFKTDGEIYENDKIRKNIFNEPDFISSALDKWIRQSKISGLFKEKDNRVFEENEWIKLRRGKEVFTNGKLYKFL